MFQIGRRMFSGRFHSSIIIPSARYLFKTNEEKYSHNIHNTHNSHTHIHIRDRRKKCSSGFEMKNKRIKIKHKKKKQINQTNQQTLYEVNKKTFLVFHSRKILRRYK